MEERIGYNVSAKDMAEELNRIKASSEKGNQVIYKEAKYQLNQEGDSIDEEYQNYLKNSWRIIWL